MERNERKTLIIERMTRMAGDALRVKSSRKISLIIDLIIGGESILSALHAYEAEHEDLDEKVWEEFVGHVYSTTNTLKHNGLALNPEILSGIKEEDGTVRGGLRNMHEHILRAIDAV